MENEAELLQQYLDLERNHVLGILEGFSEEQLRRPPCRRAGIAWAW
jgi:hypothetical protein